MTRDIEYGDAMTDMLELIWGVGFMTPGGENNVNNMIEGIDLDGKRVLDIGCGIGGPAFLLASKHGARVVGIDIEQPLIEKATRRAEELGRTIEPQPAGAAVHAWLPRPDCLTIP